MFVSDGLSLLRDRDRASGVSANIGVCGTGVSIGVSGLNVTFDDARFEYLGMSR